MTFSKPQKGGPWWNLYDYVTYFVVSKPAFCACLQIVALWFTDGDGEKGSSRESFAPCSYPRPDGGSWRWTWPVSTARFKEPV